MRGWRCLGIWWDHLVFRCAESTPPIRCAAGGEFGQGIGAHWCHSWLGNRRRNELRFLRFLPVKKCAVMRSGRSGKAAGSRFYFYKKDGPVGRPPVSVLKRLKKGGVMCSVLSVFSVVKKRHEARGTRLEVFGFIGRLGKAAGSRFYFTLCSRCSRWLKEVQGWRLEAEVSIHLLAFSLRRDVAPK